MAPKPRALVDLNIVLDFLQRRQSHYQISATLLDTIAREAAIGLLAAHSITTLFYLINLHQSHQVTTSTLNQLLNTFSVATINEQVIRDALALNWKDFEDAVQMAAAVNASADYLVTRNQKNFELELIPVLQPGAFLSLLTP